MNVKLLVSALAGTLILTGCANRQPVQAPEPVPEVEPVKLVESPLPNVRVTYADERAAGAVKVLNVRCAKTQRFPKLTFELVNVTQVKLPVEYKVQWVDADGAPLQSTAAWQQAVLSGSEAKPVVSIGRAQEAAAAYLTVRFPVNVELYVPTPDPVEKAKIERQVIDDYNARLSSGQLKLN